jgi:hypothetical protein
MDKVKQLINESINEELCIADEVVLTANEICNEICSWKIPKKSGNSLWGEFCLPIFRKYRSRGFKMRNVRHRLCS